MSRPSFRQLIWVNIAIALGIFCATGRAQPPDGHGDEDDDSPTVKVRVKAEGMEAFRLILYRLGIEPVANVADLQNEPEQTVIILLGKPSIDRFLNEDILTAVRNGASILIASDRFSNGLERFGFTISNEEVAAASRDCYKGRNRYPIVWPMTPARKQDENSPHSVFDQFERSGPNAIATNLPGVLYFVGYPTRRVRSEPLANFPDTSRIGFFDGRQIESRPIDQDSHFFAAGGTYFDGRFLLLADHSIFINVMMLPGDNDNANALFAQNCIKYLRGPNGKKRCLFVEEGTVRTQFDLPVPDPPWLDMMLKALLVMERHGDGIVNELEERDFFNQALLMTFSRREIMRFVLIAVTILLLAFGFVRLIRSRIGPDPARTLITPELAAMIPRGNVLQQRFEGLIDANDVREPAGQLVRDFFAGLGAEPDAHGRPPQVAIEDGYRDEFNLRRKIMRLWQLGYGPTTRKVPPAEWQQLTEDLKSVLEDADEGWWRFTQQSSPLPLGL